MKLGFAPIIVTSIAVLALGGCRVLGLGSGVPACHQPQAYAEAQNLPPLEIPAGLEAPDTSRSLRIPELNEPEPPPRKAGDPCLDEPPPYSTSRPASPAA